MSFHLYNESRMSKIVGGTMLGLSTFGSHNANAQNKIISSAGQVKRTKFSEHTNGLSRIYGRSQEDIKKNLSNNNIPTNLLNSSLLLTYGNNIRNGNSEYVDSSQISQSNIKVPSTLNNLDTFDVNDSRYIYLESINRDYWTIVSGYKWPGSNCVSCNGYRYDIEYGQDVINIQNMDIGKVYIYDFVSYNPINGKRPYGWKNKVCCLPPTEEEKNKDRLEQMLGYNYDYYLGMDIESIDSTVKIGNIRLEKNVNISDHRNDRDIAFGVPSTWIDVDTKNLPQGIYCLKYFNKDGKLILISVFAKFIIIQDYDSYKKDDKLQPRPASHEQ